MNGNQNVRIVTGNHYSEPLTFDLAKIAPVASCFLFYSQWVPDDKHCIGLGQPLLPQFVLRVPGEVHAPLRGGRSLLSPSRREKRRFGGRARRSWRWRRRHCRRKRRTWLEPL